MPTKTKSEYRGKSQGGSKEPPLSFTNNSEIVYSMFIDFIPKVCYNIVTKKREEGTKK